jgi:hypothetical protein
MHISSENAKEYVARNTRTGERTRERTRMRARAIMEGTFVS